MLRKPVREGETERDGEGEYLHCLDRLSPPQG